MYQQLLQVFPTRFVNRNVKEWVERIHQAGAVHPLAEFTVAGVWPQPETLEAAKHYIRRTTDELLIRGRTRIAFCPAGGFTLEALRELDLRNLEVHLYDNQKASQNRELDGMRLLQVEALPEHHYDCLFVASSLHTGTLLEQFAHMGSRALQRVKLPFFPRYEVVADPRTIGFPESEPLLVDKEKLPEAFLPPRCDCRALMARAYLEQREGETPDWFLNEPLKERCLRADAAASAINQLCCKAQTGKAIVLAAYRFAFNYVKHAMALRKQGYRVILLALEDNVNESNPLSSIECFFDGIFSTAGDWEEYCMVLARIEPSLIHALSMIRLNEFGLLVSCMAKVPVVVEFNDITSHGHTPAGLSELIGAEPAEDQYEMERRICQRADGIVDKDRPDAVQQLLARHDAGMPYLVFPSYASPEFFEERKPDAYGMSVIYVGGVNSNVGLDSGSPTTTLINAADTLSEQGIRFRIMNVYDHGSDHRFEAYVRKAAESHFFSYVPSQPIQMVPKLISAYSYGWLVFDLSEPDRRREFFSTAMASKFFTYIEAGLPVICSAELESVTEIVQHYDIGFSISWADLPDLSDIARRQNLAKQRDNVLRYRERINMENQIVRLIDFYESLLSRNHRQGRTRYDSCRF